MDEVVAIVSEAVWISNGREIVNKGVKPYVDRLRIISGDFNAPVNSLSGPTYGDFALPLS